MKLAEETVEPDAGWYPDPTGPAGRLRWWNGTTWTDHVEDIPPAEGQQAPASASPASPTSQAGRPGHPRHGGDDHPRGLISSGRISRSAPGRSRRPVSSLLLPPAIVAAGFVILLAWAAGRTNDVNSIPDGDQARQSTVVLADHLRSTLGIEPTRTFSGSVVENPDAGEEMFMELSTCASDRQVLRGLTSISGAEVRDPSVLALVMVGTGDVGANRAYVEALVDESRSCTTDDSGREHLGPTVDEQADRLQLIDHQHDPDTGATWVFVARAEDTTVVSAYVATTIDIDSDELTGQLLVAIDAAVVGDGDPEGER